MLASVRKGRIDLQQAVCFREISTRHSLPKPHGPRLGNVPTMDRHPRGDSDRHDTRQYEEQSNGELKPPRVGETGLACLVHYSIVSQGQSTAQEVALRVVRTLSMMRYCEARPGNQQQSNRLRDAKPCYNSCKMVKMMQKMPVFLIPSTRIDGRFAAAAMMQVGLPHS